jgi:hypothetical protein
MRKPALVVVFVLLTLPLFGASRVFNPELAVAPAEYGPTFGTDAQVATSGEVYAAIWTDSRVHNHMAYVTRFRPDGTVLDAVGTVIPGSRQAGAIVWTGRAFLLSYIDQKGNATARTLTVEGALGDPVELFNIFYLGTTRLRMATNGETVLIVSSQATVAILDLDGRKIHQFAMPWSAAYDVDAAAAGTNYLVAGVEQTNVITQLVRNHGELGPSNVSTGAFVSVASDGGRFLVVSGGDALRSQLVTRDGLPDGASRELARTRVYPASAVWRGGEYLLTYQKDTDTFTQRLNEDGALTGSVVTINLGTLIRGGIFVSDMATAEGEGVVVGNAGSAGLVAAFFDAQSVTTAKPLKYTSRIAQSARKQSQTQLARNGLGRIAGWVEVNPDTGGNEIRISAGIYEDPVVVDTAAFRIVDIVVESGVVWVVWTADDAIYTRRYTPALDAIDPAPVKLHDVVELSRTEVAVAAGDGAVAVVFHTGPGAWNATQVEAYVLRSKTAGVEMRHAVVSADKGRDHDVAVAFDGVHFVVAWANATTFDSHRPNDTLDDDVLTRRLSTTGGPLGATATLARGKSVDTLRAARGENGVAVVWQTFESPDFTVRRRTYGAYAATGVVKDLGGEDLVLASLVDFGGGFLLARGSITEEVLRAPIAQLEVVALDGELTPTDTMTLPEYEIDTFWRDYGLVEAFDADLLGGPSPLLAYSRVSKEVGGVSRVFTRDTREVRPRRRGVR